MVFSKKKTLRSVHREGLDHSLKGCLCGGACVLTRSPVGANTYDAAPKFLLLFDEVLTR